MRKIKILRQKGAYGKMRKLKLFIDDKNVANVGQGEHVELEIEDDASELWGEKDWGKTLRFSLDCVSNGDVVIFKPYFTFNTLRQLGVMSLPMRIRLQS